MKTYTEDQIIAALNEASRKHGILPATGTFLKELRGRGEPVLFTKDDLLAVAATEREKLMIHGIFAVFGTASANEAALIDKAWKANMAGNMEILIRLAKARKEENLQVGATYRDADGKLVRYTAGGFMQYILFDAYIEPKRPLEKI